MLNRLIAIVFSVLMIIAAAGCSDTFLGGALGAGGGALVGSAVGHPLLGAAVGGVGGAALGYGIGHSSQRQETPPPQPSYDAPPQHGYY
jgi:hypothetical protein